MTLYTLKNDKYITNLLVSSEQVNMSRITYAQELSSNFCSTSQDL